MLDVKGKEEKQHKATEKRNKKSSKYEPIEEKDCCKKLDVDLSASEHSPILRSPIPDRRNQRREAVSEQNATERAVVTSTLKHYIQGEHAARYALK